VRIVAGQAIPILHRLVNGLFILARNVVMAVRAGFLDGFFQEALEVRGVGRMTVQTLARLDRLMFDLARRQRIVVARQAKLVAFFDEQVFVVRLVRVVATVALAALRRLVLDLGVEEKILVAGPA